MRNRSLRVCMELTGLQLAHHNMLFSVFILFLSPVSPPPEMLTLLFADFSTSVCFCHHMVNSVPW